MLAAPLIAGADLRHLDPEVRRILTNRDIIAVDQDRLGIQGFVALRDRELQIFAKPLEGGDWAIAFLNRGDVALRIDHDWKKSPLRDDQNDRSAYFPDDTFAIRNLWTGEKAGTTATPLVATIGARDLLMFRLTPVPAAVGRKAP
jgi:alpha-galactosidase